MRGNRYAKSYSDALPDFIELAESLGIEGLRAEHPDAVDSLITEMLAHPARCWPIFGARRASTCSP